MPGLQAVAKGAKPGFAPFAFLRHGFAAVAWFRRVRVGACDGGRDRRQGLGFALGSIALALSGAVAAQDYQPQMDGFNSTMDSMQSVAGTAAVNAAIKRSLSQRSGAAAPAQRPDRKSVV